MYEEEATVKVVPGNKTVDQRIQERKQERRQQGERRAEMATKAEMVTWESLGDVVLPETTGKERRAQILNEATDLIEESYNKLRAAIDTMSICDLGAQEKYAGLVREMGKTVRDFSGRL